MTWDIPSFIKFSLPDGLWVYSFTFYLASIWKFSRNGLAKFLFLITPFLLGVGVEIMQLYIAILGTFDWNDLCISLIAYVCGYLFVNPVRQNRKGHYIYG